MALLAYHFRTPDYDDPNIDNMPQATAAFDEANAWDIVRQKARDFIQTVIHDTPSNIDELDDRIVKGGCDDENGTTVKYTHTAKLDGQLEYSIEGWSVGNLVWLTVDIHPLARRAALTLRSDDEPLCGLAIFEARIYA